MGQALEGIQMRVLRILVEQLTHLGGLVFYCILLGFFALSGRRGILLALLLSLIACMGFAVLIRLLYFKPRPKRIKHSNLLERLNASSFPSIHSMRALSLAFWLSLHFSSLVIAGYLVGLALLVMVSRLVLKKHDILDVFWGMVFSFGINLLIWWLI
jgi:membrane-associated phospholipid phosphatase